MFLRSYTALWQVEHSWTEHSWTEYSWDEVSLGHNVWVGPILELNGAGLNVKGPPSLLEVLPSVRQNVSASSPRAQTGWEGGSGGGGGGF